MKLFHDLQKENIFPEIDCYLQLRTAGIGESALAEKIQPILNGIDGLIIGYCAHAGMVDLRLSSLDANTLSEEKLNEIGDTCRKNWERTLYAMEIVPWRV